MITRIVPIAIAVFLVAGCANPELVKLDKLADKLPLGGDQERAGESAPSRLVAIWSDAVYTQPGKPAIRGFGGRLYFYDANNRPVAVHGRLVVYAYDDSNHNAPAKEPSRKFVFTADQFASHYTPSDLGPSYSLWIPWDPVGGVRKAISLLPVFTCTNGQVVMGHQSINILPGSTPENVSIERKGYLTPLSTPGDSGARPASYDQQHAQADTRHHWEQTHTFIPKNSSRKRLRTTTIDLPMSLTRRLMPAPGNAGAAWGGLDATANIDGNAPRRLPSSGQARNAQVAHRPTGNASPDIGTDRSAPTARPVALRPEARSARPQPRAPAAPSARSSRAGVSTPLRRATPRRAHPSAPGPFPSRATGES